MFLFHLVEFLLVEEEWDLKTKLRREGAVNFFAGGMNLIYLVDFHMLTTFWYTWSISHLVEGNH